MNKSLRYIALLAIIPLFTTGLTTDYFTNAEAIKSQGNDAPGRYATHSYGSANNSIVCGDRLCSEIPGGRAAFEEQQRMPTLVEPVTEEETTEEMMEETTEEMMEETTEEMMEETMMEEVTEADLGSVLRLSRANVPTNIPLHQGYYDGGDFTERGLWPDHVLKASSTSMQKFKTNSFQCGMACSAFSLRSTSDNSRNSITLSTYSMLRA